MTGQSSGGEHAKGPRAGTPAAYLALLGTVCALVIGLYAWGAKSGWVERWGLNADNTYYNLLVQGLRAGQLNLKREVPSGLAQLANPYDPKAMTPYLVVKYPLVDLSYYQGKLYLYFGVTPALLVFWPYAALTGHSLLHRDAVVIFFSVGFIAGVGLLCAAWRRYFAQVSVGTVVAGALALGLVNFAPVILQRCDVYEVAISCGYALTMITLVLVWRAMHATRGRAGWLAGASLAYGLALGTRPSLLCGALILLVPVAAAWRERREPGRRPPWWTLWLAATGPIVLVGMGLMLYNALRFGDPLEFGSNYQLTQDRAGALQQFSLRYLWFNFRVGFLAPAWWSGHFPFVQDIAVPPLPEGGVAEQLPFGILANNPLVWLALAVPLAWRSALPAARSTFRGLLAALAVLFGTSASILCLHNSMCLRYQVEFLAALVLLAVLGVFVLEQALAGRGLWQRTTRWSWGLLLALSAAFNLFASLARLAEAENDLGATLVRFGKAGEAIDHCEKALRIKPEYAEAHYNLGVALFQTGRVTEAMRHLEEALRLKPEDADAHCNLAKALFQQGRVAEAIGHYQQAARVRPGFAEAHYHLAAALFQVGKVPEAIGHLEQLLALRGEDADAHYNLGKALLQVGRVAEAIEQYDQALRLKPDDVETHSDLGTALFRLGKIPDAIAHYEQVFQLAPDHANARTNLSVALLQWGGGLAAQGRWREAVGQYQRVLEIMPDNAAAHDSLGLALTRVGRHAEALVQFEKALAIDRRLVSAQEHAAWLLATCPEASLRNGPRAVKLSRKADRLAGIKDPQMMDILAAAYAESGRFARAKRIAREGLKLARETGRAQEARQIRERLKLYKNKQPYHTG